MSTRDRIAKAFERNAEVLRRRPQAGLGTSNTTVRLLDGLACQIESGEWRLVADQPGTTGGDNRGPDPGDLGRAALGICLAQGYVLALALAGLTVRGLEVRVESLADRRGMFGVDAEVPAGSQGLRCSVTVDSDADEAAIREALDEADRRSPWLYNFKTALPVEREITIR